MYTCCVLCDISVVISGLLSCVLLQCDGSDYSILSKLQFVVYLVRCVLDLAESRQMLSVDSDNVSNTNVEVQMPSHAFKVNHACYLASSQCCVEQLVLYMRGLHLLSSALQLAKLQMKAGLLTPSEGMKNSK